MPERKVLCHYAKVVGVFFYVVMTDFVYYKYCSKSLTKKLKPEESTEVHQFLSSQVQVYNGDYQQWWR